MAMHRRCPCDKGISVLQKRNWVGPLFLVKKFANLPGYSRGSKEGEIGPESWTQALQEMNTDGAPKQERVVYRAISTL